jgi:large subunit ribosomal protein L29
MKAADYRKMTDEELQKELDGLRKSQFQTRTKQVTDVVENSASIKNTRKDVARVLTILAERKAKAAAKAAPAPKKEEPKTQKPSTEKPKKS